jgi:hypothetical protein
MEEKHGKLVQQQVILEVEEVEHQPLVVLLFVVLEVMVEQVLLTQFQVHQFLMQVEEVEDQEQQLERVEQVVVEQEEQLLLM